ncbi:MAG: type II toxin-antitoxin system mRNA interferase toxin, RelE/StbE family [Spirochaetes bacterium]|nr:MAG: type II toxin-antitoxin system mRNA interferase toxin, RelE/StbE family [Spirochaetota bacterium]
MDDFKIAETDSFVKMVGKSKFNRLYKKINEYVYPMLRRNPYFGPNIKRLKGQYSDYYRYRIGDYRLFYKIDEEKILIFIIDIKHRKEAYD